MPKHKGGRPLKFKTPEELVKKGAAFFKACDKDGKPYTITGLANYLDTSRETLINYEERDEFFDTIKRLKQTVEEYAETRLYLAKNAAGPIFALKNFGWRDRQELDHTSKGEKMPVPILANLNVSNNDGDQKDSRSEQENPSHPGRDISE